MVYRPFRQIGRFGLAACAVSLAAASLSAQTAPTAPVGPNPSRVDVFMGYSYFGAHGQVKPAAINYSILAPFGCFSIRRFPLVFLTASTARS